ncbi:MAG: ABC transporter permease subunit [Peptoniphilaceae bacterium]|uniref:ABC transporter permease n=1 Tax=Parvimonas sp. TaxID=1944660 RepID=UPI0025FB34B6|nr:ABC transporter permease subunit [Parvimonas sp.]MCI5997674.1 ABC transporter permease subunit [Parvimonas sp.]MDD7764733.1 ABC transporter permease subunit [Peptoniphilaceae bacterium]MDY3051179.1 ABC transporter permease subunit [Parvimonas sp.]
MKRIKKYYITGLIVLVLFLIYYYITENKIANPYLFPDVSKIKKAFVDNKGVLFLNLIYSLKLMLPSIIISLVIALIIGTILGLNEKLRDVLYPIIYTFSVIPSILLSPFALLMAPNFWSASLFLIVYGTLWSTLFATITGIMTIDKRYLEKAETLEIYGMKRFLKIILPAASPSILSGFVNSLRSTFIMLVYAEMYGSKYGMGFFVKKYSEFGLYDKTWAGFLFLVIILVVVMQIFEIVKKRILKWTAE